MYVWKWVFDEINFEHTSLLNHSAPNYIAQLQIFHLLRRYTDESVTVTYLLRFSTPNCRLQLYRVGLTKIECNFVLRITIIRCYWITIVTWHIIILCIPLYSWDGPTDDCKRFQSRSRVRTYFQSLWWWLTATLSMHFFRIIVMFYSGFVCRMFIVRTVICT